MKKELPHLLPALIAMLILASFLLAGNHYIQLKENRYIHVLAPMLLPQTLNGSALQQTAFSQSDLLPVYGSSELVFNETPYTAYLFFKTYPTGFTVFEVARKATASLIMAEELAALGPELRGKKVVISFTPSMFETAEVPAASYEGNYSKLHGEALIFDPYLSFSVKQQAARRMLDYPGTLKNDPLLKFAVLSLSSASVLHQALYYLAMPLAQLQILIIRLQDQWQVLNLIGSNPKLSPKVRKEPISIQWNVVIAQAEAIQAASTNNNPYGIANSLWTQSMQQAMALRSAPAGSRDAAFTRKLNNSKEWSDLSILLEVLKEMGAKPLIMSRPINGPTWQVTGVSMKARQRYYDQLNQIVVEDYGMPLVDFENHDGDQYFSTDSASHTSRLGWAYVDQTLDAFFHGNLH